MGKSNNVWKRYFRNKRRLADLFNGIYFQGEDVIKAEQLEDATEVYVAADAENPGTLAKNKIVERIRDVKMKLHTGEIFRMLGIEDQNEIDYTMPFRCMQYDTMEYGSQLDDLRRKNDEEDCYSSWAERICKVKKNDRIFPVYTLCLYHGEELWDGPRCLKDMMEFGEDMDGMSKFFADYPFRLICLNEIEDFEVFHSEIKQLFKAAKYRKNKKKLCELMETDPEYWHMDGDTLEVMSVMLNAPKLWENRKKYMKKEEEKEEYDMCQALRELEEDARSEGIKEGIINTLVSLVKQGLLQVTDAARQADMSESEFQEKLETWEV